MKNHLEYYQCHYERYLRAAHLNLFQCIIIIIIVNFYTNKLAIKKVIV